MARKFITTRRRTPLRRKTACKYGKTKMGKCRVRPAPKKRKY